MHITLALQQADGRARQAKVKDCQTQHKVAGDCHGRVKARCGPVQDGTNHGMVLAEAYEVTKIRSN
jgi:hypothetical protein